MIAVALIVLAQASSGWASARPPECAALETGRSGNAWERAKSPELRRYCDLLASAAAKLAGAAPQTNVVISLADEADKIVPGKAAPHALKGRALALRGDWQGAHGELSDARAKDERVLDDPRTLLAWARVLSRTGKANDAAVAFQSLLPRASMLAPFERAAAEIEAGMLAMARGPASLDEATAILRQAARDAEDAAQIVAVAALALAIDRGGDSEEARALLAERVPSDAPAILAARAARDLVGPGGEPDLVAMHAIVLEGKDAQLARAEWQKYTTGPWVEHARARVAALAGKKGPVKLAPAAPKKKGER